MQRLQTFRQSARPRLLALLAVLFVFGLQTFEVSHSHQHDSAVECLTCKSSSVGTVTVAPATTLDKLCPEAPHAEKTPAAQAAAFSLYYTRGPPHIS